ncbi:MAG: hypothetical protein HYX37_20495 [Rhizobiales bacterium]|nr:hypothetical protein [Hyphomicrobiales bacterium]
MADVSIVGGMAPTDAAPAVPGLRRRVLLWSLASAGMVAALLAPALWNGFPLVFPDTGGYLSRPIEGTLGMGRSALYGLFLYAGIPTAFWVNVIAQAALTAWLIVLTMRALGLGGRPWLALGIVAMLTVCTSLPWFAGQLMPDILFPAAVLAIYLLAFQAAQLTWWERCGLAAVIVIAIPSHMAAAGLGVALIAALWPLARIARMALPKPRLLLAAGAVAAGVAFCPISNYAITGTFGFTPGGSSFLFGRLLEDGIVARYLDDRCPDPALRLCDYKVGLPDEADWWLWGDSPFHTLGGWVDFAAEERAITIATLKRYPLMHAETAILATLRQFVAFQTETSITDNEPTIATLADRTPQLFEQFMRARQQANPFDVAPLNFLHVPAASLSIAGLALALIARRRFKVAPDLAALCLTILLALAANAAICGIFSHPVDRYQSRLVPLAPFALALLIARRHGAFSGEVGTGSP